MKQMLFLRKVSLLAVMIAWGMMGYAQRYEKDRGKVYFGNELVMYADARSFVDLGCGYAKDRYNVYMNGRVLENVDPSTFRLKERSAWRFTIAVSKSLAGAMENRQLLLLPTAPAKSSWMTA